MQTGNGDRMKRVIVDRSGGPEVLRIVEEDVPRPGPGEVRVRVLAAGVSYTDAMLRVGSYLGVPKPPFTPGYELVGVVEEVGPNCTRLRVGDRIGSLTVWGAHAERVCVLETNAVKVPGGHRPRRDPGPGLHLYDRLPAASPHGEGEERGDGTRPRGGRGGWVPRSSSSQRWLAFARTGPVQLATSPRLNASALWRSTTGLRTSWPGRAS